jgi:hypothetical protein
MSVCEICGNDYDKAFSVTPDGKTHTFDSFDCASPGLAPRCDDSGVRIVGHGMGKWVDVLLPSLRRKEKRQRNAGSSRRRRPVVAH